jgi:hypothetical protein
VSDFQYRKSSYSDPDRECVEIATNMLAMSAVSAVVAIRDSKNPGGPTLRLRPVAWGVFQAAVREGGLQRLE